MEREQQSEEVIIKEEQREETVASKQLDRILVRRLTNKNIYHIFRM